MATGSHPAHGPTTTAPGQEPRLSSLLEILMELGFELSAAETPREVAMMILRAADRLFGFDACAVDLCGPDCVTYSLVTMDTFDGERHEVQPVYHEISPESMFRRALDHGPQIILRDPGALVSGTDNLRSFGEKSRPSASLLFVPIRRGSDNIGLITIQSYTPYRYSHDDLKQLQVLADYCSGALARSFAEEQLREANKRLERALAELERSNKDLEQFAYVASHDLQEPLRMVSSYVQLLARRYKGKLDADADEFIHYAVDGANRMRDLIRDLLTYSRVGTKGERATPVSMEEILDLVAANLQTSITESGAEIVRVTPLPEVPGDGAQMLQLVQNLISNAIKFRRHDVAPRIAVSAQENGSTVVFSVRDNGIGIPAECFDRVFVIFQRLQSREEYPGTGIGLALCKKIVQRHHGRIWLESIPGQGSIFFFEIPRTEVTSDDD